MNIFDLTPEVLTENVQKVLRLAGVGPEQFIPHFKLTFHHCGEVEIFPNDVVRDIDRSHELIDLHFEMTTQT